MKAYVTLTKYPVINKFIISKIDIQQAQGICKLAEKLMKLKENLILLQC